MTKKLWPVGLLFGLASIGFILGTPLATLLSVNLCIVAHRWWREDEEPTT